ncbi:MAG: type VI secretion system baseplate subunit TssK [Defluviimonas sp.]|nr:type VI secretion system baseplate subunit TssK [Defluviimonas sp.]
MSWYSKVAWKEGLFLQPQHLQQNDRYLEKLLEARTRHLSPYPWGVEELRFNRDRLQQGRIELTRVAGILPDGTPFDAPGVNALPPATQVPEGSDGVAIWLTLPDVAMNGREIAMDAEAGVATRYILAAETVADSASAMRVEQQIEIAEPRLELDIRSTAKPGYQCLKIGRILEVRDNVVILDDTFPPPVVTLNAHPVVIGWLDRVIGWVETKLDSLARYAADPSAGGGLQATDYFMLLLLNREINVLRHFRQSRYIHPERLYEEFLRFSGELWTFDQDTRLAPEYAAYDHGDLKSAFEPMVRDIQRLLSRDVGRATRLELRQVGQSSYLAQVADRNLFRDATFVIEVESSRPLTQVQLQFPELCKIGPNTRMAEIVNNNLPGIALIHTPTPPRQIRAVSRNVYFLLDKNTPLWREFSTAPAIGMHFAGDWPDLKLDLWAIVESRT